MYTDDDSRNIIVFGAHSYIGRKFIEYVKSEKKHPLWNMDAVSCRDDKWREIDLSSFQVIVFAAAIVHNPNVDMAIYDKVNYRLPIEVAKKAKEQGVEQFIFLSTMSVYGNITGEISKYTIPNPTTVYGKSKYQAEKGLLELSDETFTISILRCPMVYGYECKGNFQRLIKLAIKAPVFPKINNRKSLLYIDNLSNYLVQIIIQRTSGILYPCDGADISTSDMYIQIRKALGKRTYTIRGMNPLIRLLMKYVNSLKKMFGDLYYQEDDKVEFERVNPKDAVGLSVVKKDRDDEETKDFTGK